MATDTEMQSKYESLLDLPDGVVKKESADTSLTELRSQYGYEASRTQSVSAKASGLLAFDALVLAFVGNFSDLSFASRLLVVVFVLFSVGFILLVMLNRKYLRPLTTIREAGSHATMNSMTSTILLIESYMTCIEENQQVNDKLVLYYEYAIVATALSIIVITLVSFV